MYRVASGACDGARVLPHCRDLGCSNHPRAGLRESKGHVQYQLHNRTVHCDCQVLLSSWLLKLFNDTGHNLEAEKPSISPPC
jgi:hypothetical protein